MVGQAELLAHIHVLLSNQLWEAAALHVRHAAQLVSSRREARALLMACQAVPLAQRAQSIWPEALLWLAYRLANEALLSRALQGPRPAPAFEAFRASLQQDWPATLCWAEQAWQAGTTAPERAVAARYRALASAELNLAHWQETYHEALAAAQGRERGLIHLDCAFQHFRYGQDALARDQYAQASTLLQGDAWGLSLTQVNLGMTCLRLGDLSAAERALKSAVQSSLLPEGRPPAAL